MCPRRGWSAAPARPAPLGRPRRARIGTEGCVLSAEFRPTTDKLPFGHHVLVGGSVLCIAMISSGRESKDASHPCKHIPLYKSKP